jgi:diguanylate cyclase (GGDEF)-like protein
MFRVLECVWYQHDRAVEALAASIWIVAGLTLFLALAHAEESHADRRGLWRAMGGFAGGLGVWATHFVAMLAYRGGLPIGYAVMPTLLSAIVAIIGFWSATRIVAVVSPSRCAMAGTVTAFSVGAMHFIGMAGIQAQARISYDWKAVAVSAVIAVVLFTAAFAIFAGAKGYHRIWGATLASAVGVCVLHFTGMAATTLSYDPSLPRIAVETGREWLIGAIVASTMVVTLLTGASALIDRYLTDLKGFAGATLEGLAIVQDDRVVEVNARFAEWVGRPAEHLVGSNPESLLIAADGLPVVQSRAKPVEAVLRGDVGERVFEVAAHGIEYRGRSSQVLAVRDLTETKTAQRRIEYLARHDDLTGLPNRAMLHERLTRALALSRRTGEPLALLALDLDRFKTVNDIFGHAEGDRVLQAVAEMLKRCVRGADTVARLGGDEFVILQVGAPQPEGARQLAHRILELFREEMDPAMDPAAVGISLGVAICPQDGVEAAELHYAADIALYRTKTTGRGHVVFFDAQMDAESRERRQLEADLRHALARKQFHLVYQPLVRTRDGRASGYEALLRWTHPVRGEVLPDAFIGIAEDTGAILPIGEWVLRTACRDAAQWDEPLTLAVNISAVQFQVSTLEDIVISALEQSGLEPERLELEITESAMMSDRAETLRVLRALKHRGVRVVMDDFGTGYSSLGNLRSFPFDKIKIDRSFIQSMESDETARSIIRAIVGIGRSLGLPVVAEGVETSAQHRMVEAEGCMQAQGFYYGRPGEGPALASDQIPSAGAA